MLRADAPHFERFGEIYFSWVYPGAVKAWHKHLEMTCNYAVPVGRIKLVLFDDREGSATKGAVMEIFLGDARYDLVTVPPLVWNGFKGVGMVPAMVANCATVAYRQDEMVRADPSEASFPYTWELRHR